MRGKKHTFGEWLNEWFETYKKPNLKPTSVRNIEQMIRLHTPQWLKDKLLIKIEVLDIDKALAKLPKGRTAVYARQVWGSAVRKACNIGLLDRNVLQYSEPVKYRKQRGKALTIQEQEEFLKNIENKPYKWLMLFYLYTGVRRVEALTLEWSDIDEQSEIITIKGTKTEESYRDILLTKEVKYILSERRKQVPIEESKVFNYSKEYVSRLFKKVCPNHKLHDLRHTFITRCAENGMNITVCQNLVGHATADMTLNVYTHVMDEYKRKEGLKYDIFPKIYKKDTH